MTYNKGLAIMYKKGSSIRYIGPKFPTVKKRLRAASKNVNYGDVIQEDPMPDFGGLLKSLGRFFEATRPLKPERKERSRTAAPVKNPKIIVSVRGAQNLPIRKIVNEDEVIDFLGLIIKHILQSCLFFFHTKKSGNIDFSDFSTNWSRVWVDGHYA